MAILRPGQTFASGYRLESLISRGGMGEVWRATKQGTHGWQKELALKVILPTVADQDRFVTMFLQEARLAALLDHPNIVPVFNFGRDRDVLFLELELVRGSDLRGILGRAGALPMALALYVARAVLEALDYAHGLADGEGRPLGIVHRDIKPHNVLVAREGFVKLVDFGIAKATAEASASRSELKGTVGYIAPEVLDGAPATARSDLFAVGVVLWECLAGRRLFDGESEAARLKKAFLCQVPTLADVGVIVPDGVQDLVSTLLARTPEERFASAAAALRACRSLPQAGAPEMKEFLAALPAPDRAALAPTVPSPHPAAVRETTRTGSLAGEVTEPSGAVSSKLNRLFGSRPALAALAGGAALSVAAALAVSGVGRQGAGRDGRAAVTRATAGRPAATVTPPVAARPSSGTEDGPPGATPAAAAAPHEAGSPGATPAAAAAPPHEAGSPGATPAAGAAPHEAAPGALATTARPGPEAPASEAPAAPATPARKKARKRAPAPDAAAVATPPRKATTSPPTTRPRRDRDAFLVPEDAP